MARAGGGRVELLVEREKIIGIAYGAGAGKRADASALEAGDGAAGGEGILRGAILGNAAGNVSAGSDQFRLPAAISARAAAREEGEVIGVVGARIVDAARSIAGGVAAAVRSRHRAYTLGSADRDDIFGGA